MNSSSYYYYYYWIEYIVLYLLKQDLTLAFKIMYLYLFKESRKYKIYDNIFHFNNAKEVINWHTHTWNVFNIVYIYVIILKEEEEVKQNNPMHICLIFNYSTEEEKKTK